MTKQLRAFETRREKLLSRYRSPKTTFPTCGQSLPKAKIDATRARIISKGKQVSAAIEKIRAELSDVQSKVNFSVESGLKVKQLQYEIRKLTKGIAELERQIINSQFEHVRFKLFRVLANGELNEVCAAMIDGVPFPNLSKSEKLKAALDILRTLQKKFHLEMPLFLDDAENYTVNSFVEVSNQLFLFRVTDTDLKISVDEGRRAAQRQIATRFVTPSQRFCLMRIADRQDALHDARHD